jgi:UDP-N-acetylglucosamine diphosphorylase / glucose-1-phosphate thymidylyltransferase / UDP-N-acetylgalactosamine diphosphorylase / glucosamine-1-phosphate N-acetyltransferase / galactosamine-1-phosphate N-acetyltransferase
MKQAVILAAGEGQRLRPFTATRPKVMLEIAGKPILQYVIEALARNGVREIILVVGYCKEQIFDRFGTGEHLGVNLVYIIQDKQLGTAHALSQVKGVVNNEFLVLAGDNLIDATTIAGLISAKSPTILLKQLYDARRYGVVMVEGGLAEEIIEKPTEAKTDKINTGTYVLNKDVFDFIDRELDIPEVMNKMLASGITVRVMETQGTWLDVVYPWDMIRLNSVVLENLIPQISGTIESGVVMKGLVSVGKGTIIRSNSYITGPVLIGENCNIGPNVCILPATSMGNNVTISPFNTIDNSIISDDVSIGPVSVLQDSFIDEGSTIIGHFTAYKGEADIKVDREYHTENVGALIGIGCSLGSNVVAQPGVILGNYCTVQSMKTINGRLPDKARVY